MEMEDYIENTNHAWALACKHNTFKFLSDCLETTQSISVTGAYNLAKYYLTLGENVRQSKIATVVPDPIFRKEDWQFYENACVNLCLDSKIFRTKEDALIWLQAE